MVDLSSRPSAKAQMELAAVVTAISRVKEGNHLTLLEKINSHKKDNYQYLTNLKPNRHVMEFYHGFDEAYRCFGPSGMSWNQE
jgi:hypothetical protein